MQWPGKFLAAISHKHNPMGCQDDIHLSNFPTLFAQKFWEFKRGQEY